MAKHIKLITTPITVYLSERFGHALRGNKGNSENTLPPHLEWAKLRGEALLVKRFFSYFEQRHIEDVNSQLFFWQQFKNNPDALPLLSNKTGLINAFKAQVGNAYLENTSEQEQHFIAYCCLLWDIHQQKNQSLLNIATDTFFGHFSATIFPAESRRDDVNKLKREIRRYLAQLWNIRPDIRESFTENEGEITFSLIARISGHAPCPLLTINGKRLKPTRLKAYQTALARLQQGALKVDFNSKATVQRA
ncbi:MAG: hypothetical protein JKY87_04760 [Mariprofundus sp.]|nr:hypothetical protein [Mariprofundus sp.]